MSAYYFLTPVFGLAIAAVMLGEPVFWRDAGGLAAIVAGISLVQRPAAAASRRTAAVAG